MNSFAAQWRNFNTNSGSNSNTNGADSCTACGAGAGFTESLSGGGALVQEDETETVPQEELPPVIIPVDEEDSTDGVGETPAQVPEPASLALLGAGLVGLAARARRK